MQTRIIGEYKLSLTQKNRLVIPSRFREFLNNKKDIYVSYYNHGWLEIYPEEYWEELVMQLEALPRFNTDRRDFAKIIYAQTQKAEIDSQGRFVLSEQLLEVLEIRTDSNTKIEISAIGTGDHIEIWESQRWEMQKRNLIKNIDSLSDRIALLSSYGKGK